VDTPNSRINTLQVRDTTGCRAGIQQDSSGIQRDAGYKTGINQYSQGYNRLQDILGYRSGKQQNSSGMPQIAGYTRIREDITV
jgi:hypothetical protein